MNEPRAALIIAGGRSRRMGRPKAWLDLHGNPLLRHVVDAARRAVPCVMVVGTRGQALPELPEDVVVVNDPPPRQDTGPLGASITGLEALHERGVATAYIGATDTPWLSPAHVRFVLEALEQTTGARAIVPQGRSAEDDEWHLHPLGGALEVAAGLSAALSLWSAGERAMRTLYEALDAHRIEVAELPDPRALRGCDTPEQWRAALATFRSEP